jgi:3-deoxy-manno-octulosonate cytidylyltransferase (CMP-KDO synthetase)
MDAASRLRVRRVVLASSSSVYGATDGPPSLETDRPGPLSPYAVTKLAGEQLCLAHAARPGTAASVIAEADVIVNVQGVEPFISSAAIEAIAAVLLTSTTTHAVANAYAEVDSPAAMIDHNVIKATLRHDDTALAFSRHPIPYPKGARPTYLRQLGLYAFTPEALRLFAGLLSGPVEEAEGIEMLRFLEHSYAVAMVRVVDDGMAVDTPEDLKLAESHSFSSHWGARLAGNAASE